MEDQDNIKAKSEEKASTEEFCINIDESVTPEVLDSNDHAGTSRQPLPGAVQATKSPDTKSIISKSHHNLRHIITVADVSNALKSLSYNVQQSANNNLRDIKIPFLMKQDDSSNIIDMKKFVASCFKFNKEASNVQAVDNIGNVASVLPVIPVVASTITETMAVDSNCNGVQTENIINPINTNETIVSPIDQKPAKAVKKKSTEKPDIGLSQRDSLSSIGSNVCRICMTKGKERLISPCHCKGSLANVHLSCLERWLNQVGRNHCELCGFSFPAIRTPRYTVLQALRLWFGNPRNRSHLQSDCLIFWLLSTVTAGLLAVCIVGTQYFVIEGSNFGKVEARKEEGISHRITETAMDFFMAIVLCGYSVTVYLLWKDHYVMWNRWRRANVNVRLLLSPDANPVPFVPRSGYTVV